MITGSLGSGSGAGGVSEAPVGSQQLAVQELGERDVADRASHDSHTNTHPKRRAAAPRPV
jgi:hypothetical protein